MAYNLESLITVLQQILNPDQKRWILDHKKPQMESLLEKVSSLKQSLENSSPPTENLEGQIRDAAHKAEDIIESHMLDQMLMRPGGESFTISPPDLQQVIQELDSAMMKIMDGKHQMANSSTPGVSSSPDDSSSKNIVVVGLDEDLIQLKDRLTGPQTKLKIIPIVGMGGIGKTTLARNLYSDPLIVSHFDTCAWITISQDYNVRAILLGLLGCIIGKLTDELLQEKNNQLALILYKSLCGKRYLIVLDDMWSVKAWDDIKVFFPNENHGSRILLTTRESNVAKYADSQSLHHQMHLLNKSQSWNLLHQKVFGKENCPDKLERIGRNIASNCGGLPLAIHVIGGLLSKDKRRIDFWEHVANDVRAAIAEQDEHFSNVLSLSYNHLPDHLKPCFLYMGAFPEDYEILASRVKRLWVAEGFLKSNGDKSLEEEAEDYLKALVDRNLLIIRELKSNGKPKSYSIHDLLRDLCMRKADQANFLHIKNCQVHDVPRGKFYSLRRVSAHPSYIIRDMYDSIKFMSFTRSFLCTGPISPAILSPVFFMLRLLRVLDVLEMEFHKFPREILQLGNLRYLAVSSHSPILSSEISRLCNLQTFILRSRGLYLELPSEIWEMSELRHVKFKNLIIWIESGYMKNFVQDKLQTFFTACLHDLLRSGFLDSIPNIKNLGISCTSTPSEVVDLSHLHKLETLKCLSDLSSEARDFLSKLRFPPSVRKLTLIECTIPWRFMKTLCALPNLEVLKIRECVFECKEIDEAKDEQWNATEEESCSLQFLLLERLNLVRWRADQTNLPRLRRLVIRRCSALEEIPIGIGEIPTLERIEVDECSPSVEDSARKIQEQQHEYGYCDLQVCIS